MIVFAICLLYITVNIFKNKERNNRRFVLNQPKTTSWYSKQAAWSHLV